MTSYTYQTDGIRNKGLPLIQACFKKGLVPSSDEVIKALVTVVGNKELSFSANIAALGFHMFLLNPAGFFGIKK